MTCIGPLLRRYQRSAKLPDFPAFMRELQATCNLDGQKGPLSQRIALLESLVAESMMNDDIRGEGADLAAVCGPGSLTVVDLTDPLLASDEANGIFQVLLRTVHVNAMTIFSKCVDWSQS